MHALPCLNSCIVKQVARRSGDVSEYNLSRAFVARFGVLPSQSQARFIGAA